MKCTICNHQCDHAGMEYAFIHGILYAKCGKCGSVTTEYDISGIINTHNDNSQIRNIEELNQKRLDRLTNILGHKPRQVLDYGCGNGELADFFKHNHVNCIGIDRHNYFEMTHIRDGSLDAITMIEVIEHINSIKTTLSYLGHLLRKDGVIMIETTFAESVLDFRNNSYVDPTIGHVSIISRCGLELSLPEHLVYAKDLNENIAILRKV